MISIGNDIVSLKVIDIPRTQSPPFYLKILSPSEQLLYQEQLSALPLWHFVWLLWSVKESVYKCLQRHQPNLVFSPVSIIVTKLTCPSAPPSSFPAELVNTGFADNECFCSEVTFNTHQLYARSVIYGDEVIITIAQPQERCHGEPIEPSGAGHRQVQTDNTSFSNIHWGIKQINSSEPETQAAAVREFLLEKLRNLYPGRELCIVKNDSGCPSVSIDGKVMNLPISLSHHGEYAGYAYNRIHY